MKYSILLVLLLIVSLNASAQMFSGWMIRKFLCNMLQLRCCL